MPDEPDATNFDKSRAELFDALGHPVRIKILHALEEGPLGFSELRRKVGLESGGHLQFHLGKLDGLIRNGEDGYYYLTDDGREALRVVGDRGMAIGQDNGGRKTEGKVLVSRWVLVGAVASIIFLASITGLVYLQFSKQVSSLQSQVSSLQDQLNHYVISVDACAKLGNGNCYSVLASLVAENPRFIAVEEGINYTYLGAGGEESSIVNGSVVRTIILGFDQNKTYTLLEVFVPLTGGVAGYGGYYDLADMYFLPFPGNVSFVP